MKATEAQVGRALANADPAVTLFLLYGPDDAGSRALADRLRDALGPEAERIDLDGPQLREDAARLPDAAAALSLFGERRWVRVIGGDECLPAVEALLGLGTPVAPVVLIAGALKGTSALVKLALAHPKVLAYQSYKVEGERGAAQVVAIGRHHGLRIAPDLAASVADACANDRALTARECEKFALYLDAAPDRPRDLSRDVFELLSADAAEASSFAVVDAAFDGRPDGVAAALQGTGASIDAIPLLRLATRRALLLGGLRAKLEGGRRADAVMGSDGGYLKGPEREAVARQLARWPAARLATVATRLFAAEEAVKFDGAGELVANETLLAIARVGERLR